MLRRQLAVCVILAILGFFLPSAAASPFALNVGIKGGPNGSASEKVPEERIDLPISSQFGVGWSVGPIVEFEAFEFLGVESGVYYSKDRAAGETDFTGTGVTVEQEQTAKALHVPFILKGRIPTPVLDAYAGVGVEFVNQQKNEMTLEPDVLANVAIEGQTASYTMYQVVMGLNFKAGDYRIPFELRAGYHSDWGDSFESRMETSNFNFAAGSGEFGYRGDYTAHFGIFTGIQYNFDLGS